MLSPSFTGRAVFVNLPALLVIAASINVVSASAIAQDNTEPATPPTAATETVPAVPTQPVDFAKDVFPILQKYCLECHGPELQEQDFRVDQSESLLAEDYVTPGDGANSLLYEVLISEDDDRMPPPDEEMVVPEQDINTIKTWIDQGAEWSDISALIAAEPVAAQDPTESKDSVVDPSTNDNNQTDAKTSKPTATKSPPDAAKTSLSPQAEFWLKVWRALGDLHPAAVHFPVALLVVGGVFALFGLRGSYRCSDFAFYCLWLGAISSLVASFVGWSYAWNEGHNEDPFLFDMQARLFWHRWTAVLLSIVSFLLAVWATIARRRDPDDGTIWKLGLIVMAGLTMYVGHAGGDLTHPRGYRRLYELMGIQDPAKPTKPRAFENNPPDNAATDK